MSKWGLLFRKKGNRKEESSTSIHRHTGFEVFSKSKVLWTGYVSKLDWPFDSFPLHSDDNYRRFDALYRVWLNKMTTVDCGELHVIFSFKSNVQACSARMVQELIDSHPDAAAMNIYRKRTVSATTSESPIPVLLTADADTVTNIVPDPNLLPLEELELVISHKHLVPFLPSCKFWSYQVPFAPVATSNSLSVTRLGQVDLSSAGEETGITAPTCFKVYTRETGDTAPSARQLTAHVNYGVDNTGNVRVWQAESVLLYHLLKSKTHRASISGKRVLEIGSGMTGLCGMALALLGSLQSQQEGRWEQPKLKTNEQVQERQEGWPAEVIITDGNPECVANQRVCWEMNKQVHGEALWNGDGSEASTPVSFRVLRWMRGDPHGEMQGILRRHSASAGTNDRVGVGISVGVDGGIDAGVTAASDSAGTSVDSCNVPSVFSLSSVERGVATRSMSISSSVNPTPVDVVIGADCLFFKEFHADLLYTLYTLLGCGSSDIGRNTDTVEVTDVGTVKAAEGGCARRLVYLLQPRRGGTMQLFLDTLHADPLYSKVFHVEVSEDFDSDVTLMHQQYMTTRQLEIDRGDIQPNYDPDVHQPVLITLTCV